MKKILPFLCSLALLLMMLPASATIRRVGFIQTITPVPNYDYKTFQAAHDASSPGDTIQFATTTRDHPTYSGTINKPLVLIGTGYNYNSYATFGQPDYPSLFNTGLQTLPGKFAGFNFTVGVGSAGTIFQGLHSLNVTTSNTLDSLNNITIMRCAGVNVNFDNSGVCNNWIIAQCIRPYISQSGYGLSFTANRTITNLRIENCLGPAIYYSASGPQSPVGVNSGQVLNCIFYNEYAGYTVENAYAGTSYLNNAVFVFQNCIDGMNYFTQYMNGIANTIFVNNLTTSSPVNNPVATNPGSTGNMFNINPAGNSFFVGVPNNRSGSTTLYSPDAAWQLSATSPAKNYGLIPGTSTPTDCGVYGGTNPYKPSGIPAIPSFYKLNAPSPNATSSPYTLTFSVRSNN